ncbi:MAG: hypothetical protein EBS90_13245, partial [Betaproteobacteria bacterium]|nr:hypothetical protein [Betaproteobacteria bacterium]
PHLRQHGQPWQLLKLLQWRGGAWRLWQRTFRWALVGGFQMAWMAYATSPEDWGEQHRYLGLDGSTFWKEALGIACRRKIWVFNT